MRRRNVGILVFPNVEVLDFAGPYEVFSRTRTQPGNESRRSEETAPFKVFTIAPTSGVVASAGVAAGIDMAFQVVEMLCGKAIADETAAYIEYPRR
jgi:transcriptional regulator GlxA family with amidase domain